MPLRGLFKLMIACALIVPEPRMQLFLLMVFNLFNIAYTYCYTPSVYRYTNYLNIFIHLSMIVYEIIFLLYSVSDQSSVYQQTISIALFIIIGIVMMVVIIWMIYRMIVAIR